jgi:hypothetical protein
MFDDVEAQPASSARMIVSPLPIAIQAQLGGEINDNYSSGFLRSQLDPGVGGSNRRKWFRVICSP